MLQSRLTKRHVALLKVQESRLKIFREILLTCFLLLAISSEAEQQRKASTINDKFSICSGSKSYCR